MTKVYRNPGLRPNARNGAISGQPVTNIDTTNAVIEDSAAFRYDFYETLRSHDVNGNYVPVYSRTPNKVAGILHNPPSYLLLPQTVADSLPNLGTLAGIPNAELLNGAALAAKELTPGTVSASFDGANDFINTGWTTRINMEPNPNAQLSTFGWALSASGWSPATILREAAPEALLSQSAFAFHVTGTHEASITNKFLIPMTLTGTSGIPVTAGTTYTASVYAYMVDPGVGGLHVEFQWFNAAGTSLSTTSGATVEIKPGEVSRLSVTAAAPAEAAFAAIRIPASSNVSGDVVNFWITNVLMERSGEVGSFFPTVGQLESGVASWSGTAYQSAADMGPFARGRTTTFFGFAERTNNATEDALFGTSSPTAQPSLQLGSGTQNMDWNVTSSGQVSWANAWPGNATSAFYTLVFNDAANTATLYINGAVVSSKEQTTSFTEPGPLILGARSGATAPFLGNQLPFGIYTRGLSGEEIAALYNP